MSASVIFKGAAFEGDDLIGEANIYKILRNCFACVVLQISSMYFDPKRYSKSSL